jgi:hypothetical protein
MKNHIKPLIALVSGPILLSCLPCQTSQAANVESGTAILADNYGTNTGSEALTVDYLVTESAGVYTYNYTINNPSGDYILDSNHNPTSTPEYVDAFVVAFNTATPGAIFDPLGGSFSYDVSGGAWEWAFYSPTINAGTSQTVSFESDFGPTPGNASASDNVPPSPWNSSPDGSPVPVPSPDSTNTMALLAGSLLLLPISSMLKKKAALSR